MEDIHWMRRAEGDEAARLRLGLVGERHRVVERQAVAVSARLLRHHRRRAIHRVAKVVLLSTEADQAAMEKLLGEARGGLVLKDDERAAHLLQVFESLRLDRLPHLEQLACRLLQIALQLPPLLRHGPPAILLLAKLVEDLQLLVQQHRALLERRFLQRVVEQPLVVHNQRHAPHLPALDSPQLAQALQPRLVQLATAVCLRLEERAVQPLAEGHLQVRLHLLRLAVCGEAVELYRVLLREHIGVLVVHLRLVHPVAELAHAAEEQRGVAQLEDGDEQVDELAQRGGASGAGAEGGAGERLHSREARGAVGVGALEGRGDEGGEREEEAERGEGERPDEEVEVEGGRHADRLHQVLARAEDGEPLPADPRLPRLGGHLRVLLRPHAPSAQLRLRADRRLRLLRLLAHLLDHVLEVVVARGGVPQPVERGAECVHRRRLRGAFREPAERSRDGLPRRRVGSGGALRRGPRRGARRRAGLHVRGCRGPRLLLPPAHRPLEGRDIVRRHV
mmetsp:Transcript_20093/g.48165  ORF Transcript_20093/g.48165 Transcript_20093/m.48165 type:complete len:507 (+) Transcript_20093:681-2201(+)